MSDVERSTLDAHLKVQREKTAPNLPEDQFFEQFCSEQILKLHGLDVDELASGYTRVEEKGFGDGGVDSAYLFVNGLLIEEDDTPARFAGHTPLRLHLKIIQATRSAAFETERLRKLTDLTNDLLDRTKSLDANPSRYNTAVLGLFRRFRTWYEALIPQLPELTFTFYIASKGDDPHPNVESRARDLETRVEALYSSKCEVVFVTAKRLIDYARTSRRMPLVLKFQEHLDSDFLGNAHVCLVPLPAFVNFISSEDGERREYILSPNVRGYLGQNPVNTGINETLRGAQRNEEFWWLNNGVTIIASKITPGTRELTLVHPRIVNGLQTSREIYNYSHGRDVSNDPRHVLVKVLEIADPKVANKILHTTNNQTKIDPVYMHSIEAFHEKLDMAFPAHGLHYERVKNQYFDDEVQRDSLVTLPYLMQSVIAILAQRPDQARGRPKLYGEREYRRLFREGDKPEVYANCALLMKRCERWLSEQNLYKQHQNNLRFYLGAQVACAVTKGSPPSRAKFGKVNIGEITDEAIRLSYDIVMEHYTDLTLHDDPDRVAKGTELLAKIKNATYFSKVGKGSGRKKR